MLQRLIYKEPKPLKPMPKDPFIFNKDGKIRGYFLKVCDEVHIDPSELYPKTLEEFAEPGSNLNIQTHKYNNYENKRRARIEALKQIAKHRYGISNRTWQSSNQSVLVTNLEILAQAARDEAKSRGTQGPLGRSRRSAVYDANDAAKLSFLTEDIRPEQTKSRTHRITSEHPFRKGSNDIAVRKVSHYDDEPTNTNNSMSAVVKRKKTWYESKEEDLMIKRRTSSFGRDGIDDSKKLKFGTSNKVEAATHDLDYIKPAKNKLPTFEDSSDSEDYNSVAGELEETFQRHIMMRTLQKERINQANEIVKKNEEDYMEISRKKYEDKEKKFQERLLALEKKKIAKLTAKEQIKKNHDERIYELREEEMRRNIGNLKQMKERFKSAEVRRKTTNDSRVQKIAETNRTLLEKSYVAMLKKSEVEDSPRGNVESIERKLTECQMNRNRLQSERLNSLVKHAHEIQYKHDKVKELDEQERDRKIQQTAEKLLHIESRKVINSPIKPKTASNDDDMHGPKFDWKTEEMLRAEKEAIQEYKQRERKRSSQVKSTKKNLDDYIKERREIIKQKLLNVTENISISKEAVEKKNLRMLASFYEKQKRINDLKDARQKQIKLSERSYYLDRTFTKSVTTN